MNTLKIQTEILKELYKLPCEMLYQMDTDDIYLSNGCYVVRIPQDSCYLTLEHEKIRRVYSLGKYFENRPNAYIAQSTNVLQELDTKNLIRKMESGNGAACCWIDEKYYKLFGDKYQYLITAPNEVVQVVANDKVIGAIMPIGMKGLDDNETD